MRRRGGLGGWGREGEEGCVITGTEAEVKHAAGSGQAFGSGFGWEVIKVEEFAGVGGGIAGEAREVAEEFAGVGEVGGFGGAVFVHEEGVVGSTEVREVGGEVGPSLGMGCKGLVPVERDMVDERAYAAVVEVHGVDVGDCDATNAVDDGIVFVTGGGTDGKVAGAGDAEEDGA